MPAVKDKITAGSVKDRISDPGLDDFQLCRYYAVCLLTQTENSRIFTFIKNHRARYDAAADMFVRAGNNP